MFFWTKEVISKVQDLNKDIVPLSLIIKKNYKTSKDYKTPKALQCQGEVACGVPPYPRVSLRPCSLYVVPRRRLALPLAGERSSRCGGFLIDV